MGAGIDMRLRFPDGHMKALSSVNGKDTILDLANSILVELNQRYAVLAGGEFDGHEFQFHDIKIIVRSENGDCEVLGKGKYAYEHLLQDVRIDRNVLSIQIIRNRWEEVNRDGSIFDFFCFTGRSSCGAGYRTETFDHHKRKKKLNRLRESFPSGQAEDKLEPETAT
eukprot:CAMPEP_0203753110 /NCGR_PEP_ID=MMETSP0098-20131031/6929_1 /ASSEMBLY_ACC=CAM_ASM_000208 /TAXON_ID=96639 /ORGANISM=" , Strain NY0313808BC1" /LENGTH=166 /DNA_ID=CAMNT_0050643565 /DNA_START=216 /DNA_END=712 /DNA_ORIENTATION=+